MSNIHSSLTNAALFPLVLLPSLSLKNIFLSTIPILLFGHRSWGYPFFDDQYADIGSISDITRQLKSRERFVTTNQLEISESLKAGASQD